MFSYYCVNICVVFWGPYLIPSTSVSLLPKNLVKEVKCFDLAETELLTLILHFEVSKAWPGALYCLQSVSDEVKSKYV